MARIPRTRSQARFTLDEQALSARTRPGRVRGRGGADPGHPDAVEHGDEPRTVAPLAGGDNDRLRGAGYGRPTPAARVCGTCSPPTELGRDRLYGHVKVTKNRTSSLAFCRYLRSLHPAEARTAIICDNFSPHLTTRTDTRVGDWAAGSNVEIAATPSRRQGKRSLTRHS